MMQPSLAEGIYETHDAGMERALLALLLYQPHRIEDLPTGFAAEMFAVQDHPELFTVILEKAGSSSGPIHPEVEASMPHLAGPDGYLRDLRRTFMDTSADAVASYCRALTELWRRRLLVEMADRIKLKAYLGEHVASTQSMVLEALDDVEAISHQTGMARRAQTRGGDVAEQVLGLAERAMRGERPDVIGTGLRSLDKALGGGMYPGDFVLVGGRPAMGKSGLGFNMAAAAALRGEPAAIYSPEMHELNVLRRIMSEMTSIPFDAIRDGTITQRQFDRLAEAKTRLDRAPLFIEAQGGLTLPQLKMRLRNFARHGALRVIVIDGVGLVNAPPHVERQGDTAVMTYVSKGLKQLAKETGAAVVGLSQLSRDVERRDDKRPMMADLRQSGSLEQDADAILFLFREEYYLSRVTLSRGPRERDEDWAARQEHHHQRLHDMRGKGEAIIAKLREGATGRVMLDWRGEFRAYREPVDGEYIQEDMV